MAKAEKREPVVPKEVLRAFINEYNLQTAEDVQNALKDVFSDTLQEMLEAEMAYTLGYEKHDDKNKQTGGDCYLFQIPAGNPKDYLYYEHH